MTESNYKDHNAFRMISVGIRELKSQLSRYIDLVKSGESVLVTEHNRVVAELKSPEIEISDLRDKKVFEKLVSEGKLIPAKRIASVINKSKSKDAIEKLGNSWWKEYQESKSERL